MGLSLLDALKQAHKSTTPEQWRFDSEFDIEDDGHAVVKDVQDVTIARIYQQPHDTWLAEDNAKFIALAQNTMPDLLEAVELLANYAPDLEVIKRLTSKSAGIESTRERLVKAVSVAQQALHNCSDHDNEGDLSADLIRAEGALAHFDATVTETYTVNGYVFVAMDVIANDAKDAGSIAINSKFDWDLSTSQYESSWSVNDCMMVDVTDVQTGKDEEFEYLDLAGQTEIAPFNAGKLFTVSFYLNVHLEIDDAEDEDEAIRKAWGVDYFGDLKANGIVIDNWSLSDSVPFEVKE